MDEEKALNLIKSIDLLRAAQEAETRNCRQEIIRELYRKYYEALDFENK